MGATQTGGLGEGLGLGLGDGLSEGEGLGDGPGLRGGLRRGDGLGRGGRLWEGLMEGLGLGEEMTLAPLRGLGLGWGLGLGDKPELGPVGRLRNGMAGLLLGLGLEEELGESCFEGLEGRPALWVRLEAALLSSEVKLSITCTSPGGSSRVSTMCTTLRPTLMSGTRTVAFHPLALVKSTSLPLTLTVRFNGELLAPGRAVLTFMPSVRLAVSFGWAPPAPTM
jgi:hypothetical protein